MARMVDADALIDELRTENQICITSTGHELTMNMVYSFINKQPTAYDVDKVVEELQNLKAENTYLHDEMQAIGATMGLIEKEIRNKAIDDFLREIKIDVIATTFGLRICDAERIAQQLKEGGTNGNSTTNT